VDGFREGIMQFLHNGNRLRTDAILPLVEKLENLKTCLLTLDTYRFYTSSLLLTYEGLDLDDSFHPEEQNMINLNMPTSKSAENIGSSSSASGSSAAATLVQSASSVSSDTLNRWNSPASSSSLSAESVDVRMIDFAHATHSGVDTGHCSKEHAGPDAGYIFGLSNLIKVLQDIVAEQCSC